MVRCPRCDDEVDRLYPIPREAQVAEATGTGDGQRGRACRHCVDEILEG
ncbi:MAG: hypothetical protein ABEJ89_04895 [Haloarculaceae archaeon]